MNNIICPRCGSRWVNYLGYCISCGYNTVLVCPRCDSFNLMKDGLVKLSDGTVKQRYKCKDCGRKFRGEKKS